MFIEMFDACYNFIIHVETFLANPCCARKSLMCAEISVIERYYLSFGLFDACCRREYFQVCKIGTIILVKLKKLFDLLTRIV